MQLVFLGAPGAGKGTQAALLAEKLSIPQVSTGDMLREEVSSQSALGKNVKKFLDNGELVPDEVMIRVVEERLSKSDCTDGYILDGFPRTEEQAKALDEYLKRVGKSINFAILIELSDDEIIKRLAGRLVCRECGTIFNASSRNLLINDVCTVCGGVLKKRSDDKEATIKERIAVYKKQTAPLRRYYEKQHKLKVIMGDRSIEAVHKSILVAMS